jgi:hypothetical protein
VWLALAMQLIVDLWYSEITQILLRIETDQSTEVVALTSKPMETTSKMSFHSRHCVKVIIIPFYNVSGCAHKTNAKTVVVVANIMLLAAGIGSDLDYYIKCSS